MLLKNSSLWIKSETQKYRKKCYYWFSIFLNVFRHGWKTSAILTPSLICYLQPFFIWKWRENFLWITKSPISVSCFIRCVRETKWDAQKNLFSFLNQIYWSFWKQARGKVCKRCRYFLWCFFFVDKKIMGNVAYKFFLVILGGFISSWECNNV